MSPGLGSNRFRSATLYVSLFLFFNVSLFPQHIWRLVPPATYNFLSVALLRGHMAVPLAIFLRITGDHYSFMPARCSLSWESYRRMRNLFGNSTPTAAPKQDIWRPTNWQQKIHGCQKHPRGCHRWMELRGGGRGIRYSSGASRSG